MIDPICLWKPRCLDIRGFFSIMLQLQQCCTTNHVIITRNHTMEGYDSLDLRKSVYTLCSEHPELVDTLAELGFTEIVKPVMRTTVGKVMTIPKGAVMRSMDLSAIIEVLESRGYRIENDPREEKK